MMRYSTLAMLLGFCLVVSVADAHLRSWCSGPFHFSRSGPKYDLYPLSK
jgi:hypothetical protein